MPKYNHHDTVILDMHDYLHNHPQIFAKLVWKNGEAEVYILGVKDEEAYMISHNSNVFWVDVKAIDDPRSSFGSKLTEL
jgi:hypothetical protein